jgi:two-component system, cell cycle response regulator
LSTVDQLHLMRRGFSDVVPLPVYIGQLMLRLRSLSRLALMQRELLRRQNTTREFQLLSDDGDLSLDFGMDTLLAMPLRPRVLILPLAPESKSTEWQNVIEDFAEPVLANNFEDAQHELFAGNVDATIIECTTNINPALAFVASLRSTAQFYNHPVLLNVADEKNINLDKTFAAGINDLFVGAMSADDVKARVSALLRHNRLRQHLSEECDASGDAITRDSLTGLFTYGFGRSHLQQIEKDMLRIEQPVTLSRIEIANLPAINRQFSFAAGDAVLRQVAEIVRNCLRGEDACIRYSGRTLLLVFPETAQVDASIAINRLLSILRYTMFVVPQGSATVPVQFDQTATEWRPGEDIEGAIQRLFHIFEQKSKAA